MRAEHNEAGGQLSREVRRDSKRSTMLREKRRMWGGRKEGGGERKGGRKERNIEDLLNHLELTGSFTPRIS